MKIIIQNRITRLFFRKPGLWTNDVAKAKDFDGALAAFNFAEMNLAGANAEILFKKENPVVRNHLKTLARQEISAQTIH